jgi:hypothetical protein
MRTGLVMVSVLGACICLLAALDAGATDVQVVDRATGQVLPTFGYRGHTYVAGEPGHEYELRIHSDAAQRVLAVASVDGVNAITGQTAASGQSGYVLDPYGFARIEGWRKSMSRTAAFYFTTVPDSYAARTGRPENVGVIGIALFRERIHCCAQLEEEAGRDEAAAAPSTAPQMRSDSAARAESKLGTGHGRSEYSAAQYTRFERASDTPDEVIKLYYDSRRNLLAQGIIPSHPQYADRLPQAFPGGFVSDPDSP